MVNINLFRGKAIIVAMVILGSSLGLASASVPSAFAANTVSFYTSPRYAGIVTVDGNIVTYGWTGTFAPGDRVHVTAKPVSPHSEFVRWVVNGVSVDSVLSQDTYITIGQSQGSVTALFQPTDARNEKVRPPEPTGPGPSNEDGRQPAINLGDDTEIPQ